jgi:hypothetical protein
MLDHPELIADLSALIWHSPLALVIAIGAILGSLALLGSNRRTHDETVAALKEQEAKRSDLIESMELRAVDVETSMPERGSENPEKPF